MTKPNEVYAVILETNPDARITTQFVGHDDVGTAFSASIELSDAIKTIGWGFFPGLDREAFDQAEADALAAALVRLSLVIEARSGPRSAENLSSSTPAAVTQQQPATTSSAQNVDSRAKEAAELLSLASVPGTVAMVREEAALGPCKDSKEFANRAKALGFTSATILYQIMGAEPPADPKTAQAKLLEAVTAFGGHDKVLATLRGIILAREGVGA